MKRKVLVEALLSLGTDDSEVMELLPGQEPLSITGVMLGRPDIDEDGDESTVDDDVLFIYDSSN